MNDALNNELDSLVAEILASYRSEERTHHIGKAFLPSREKIVQVIEEVRQVLFPGYFGQKDLTWENVSFYVGGLLVRLGDDLSEQVYHCLSYTDSGCPGEPCRRRASELAGEFLRRIPKIREMLAMDAQAAFDGDPAAKSIDEIIYCYPGFYAVSVYRLAHELLDLGVPLMPRIMSEYAHGLTGCDIHPGARIGKSFFIDHATGVVIGETTVIGDNVKMYQGVTLGAKSFPKDERGRVIKGLKRHPTVEDGATIYSNATILGGETVIGRGAEVGGNTYITRSVEPDNLVTQAKAELQVRSKGKAAR